MVVWFQTTVTWFYHLGPFRTCMTTACGQDDLISSWVWETQQDRKECFLAPSRAHSFDLTSFSGALPPSKVPPSSKTLMEAVQQCLWLADTPSGWGSSLVCCHPCPSLALSPALLGPHPMSVTVWEASSCAFLSECHSFRSYVVFKPILANFCIIYESRSQECYNFRFCVVFKFLFSWFLCIIYMSNLILPCMNL